MKNYYLLFLLIALVGFTLSCKKDEIDTSDLLSVNYDGPNATSPALPAASYAAGTRFPNSLISSYNGQILEYIEFYIVQAPSDAVINIYKGRELDADGNTIFAPSELIYTQNVTSTIDNNAWNLHRVSPPITLSTDDYWVSIGFTQGANQQIIGCDAGPRNINGDYLWDSEDPVWATFEDRTGTESINWNIRMLVAP